MDAPKNDIDEMYEWKKKLKETYMFATTLLLRAVKPLTEWDTEYVSPNMQQVAIDNIRKGCEDVYGQLQCARLGNMPLDYQVDYAQYKANFDRFDELLNEMKAPKMKRAQEYYAVKYSGKTGVELPRRESRPSRSSSGFSLFSMD